MFLPQSTTIGFCSAQYSLFNEFLVPCISRKHIHTFNRIKEKLRAPKAYDDK